MRWYVKEVPGTQAGNKIIREISHAKDREHYYHMSIDHRLQRALSVMLKQPNGKMMNLIAQFRHLTETTPEIAAYRLIAMFGCVMTLCH